MTTAKGGQPLAGSVKWLPPTWSAFSNEGMGMAWCERSVDSLPPRRALLVLPAFASAFRPRSRSWRTRFKTSRFASRAWLITASSSARGWLGAGATEPGQPAGIAVIYWSTTLTDPNNEALFDQAFLAKPTVSLVDLQVGASLVGTPYNETVTQYYEYNNTSHMCQVGLTFCDNTRAARERPGDGVPGARAPYVRAGDLPWSTVSPRLTHSLRTRSTCSSSARVRPSAATTQALALIIIIHPAAIRTWRSPT